MVIGVGMEGWSDKGMRTFFLLEAGSLGGVSAAIVRWVGQPCFSPIFAQLTTNLISSHTRAETSLPISNQPSTSSDGHTTKNGVHILKGHRHKRPNQRNQKRSPDRHRHRRGRY